MYRRIVVPLDGSDLAEAALSQARDLAKFYGARIIVLRVAHLPHAIVSPVSMRPTGMNPPFGAVAESDGDPHGEVEQRYVDGMARTLQAEGFDAQGQVLTGTPGTAIASVLERGDMLVMMSHGHTGFRRMFMGSVAADLVKRSPVPVLVLKAEDDK